MTDEELRVAVEKLDRNVTLLRTEMRAIFDWLIRNSDMDVEQLRGQLEKAQERALRVMQRGAAAMPGFKATSSFLGLGPTLPLKPDLPSPPSKESEQVLEVESARTPESGSQSSVEKLVADLISPVKDSSPRSPQAQPSPVGSDIVKTLLDTLSIPDRRESTASSGPSLISSGSRRGSTDSIREWGSPMTPFRSAGRKGPKLALVAKKDIVSKELEDSRKALNAARRAFAAQCEELRCALESASTEGRDVCDSAALFERQVVVNGVDPITGRIPAEKFLRYITEFLRLATQLGEKLRLRTSTLRAQGKRITARLAQKEELGETLCAVDFDQLRIHNQRLAHIIEDKNTQVLDLKRMAGSCALQLSTEKKALLRILSERQLLSFAEEERCKLQEQLDEEAEAVLQDIKRTKFKLQALQTLSANYRAPAVMDYAKSKIEFQRRERELRLWKRKLDLQTTAIRVARNRMRDTSSGGAHFGEPDRMMLGPTSGRRMPGGRPKAMEAVKARALKPMVRCEDEHAGLLPPFVAHAFGPSRSVSSGFLRFWFGGVDPEERGARSEDSSVSEYQEMPDSFVSAVSLGLTEKKKTMTRL